MKKTFCSIILLISAVSVHTLIAQSPYWQQQADYRIEVVLNDTLNSLDGFVTVTYKNNSPQTLDYIYFHLWPNAYRDNTTPFAKQMVGNGKTTFYYSKPQNRGFIDHLDFKADAETCIWKYDTGSYEMVKVYLNRPLKTGESVRISTPFRVKIPETYSRLGHVGQSYQITQWYPKPAVYDKYGWHPFPYLDQGEFYSEYGSFDVAITLPQNYIVGATGDLQDVAEQQWMDSLAAVTEKTSSFSSDNSFPASSKELKTLHYKQSNIHDFGWFADKRFHVLKGEVELPYSKQKVTTWSLFTNNEPELWTKAPQYLHDAIYYYSLWVGEYPYKQVTAVDGTISAGGGMEYPNITVIGVERTPFSLDDVITHEVGHNWFYGMLGTNERDHAWMDEGINSYYEYRYIKTKYPEEGLLERFPEGLAKFLDIAQYKRSYLTDLGYQLMARENLDQPIDITSSKFTALNYDIVVYGKTMLILDYLEAYLGTEVFDKAMKKYFETWKYKHPQPEDFRRVMEQETGKDLSWFFDDLLNTTKKLDYKIAKVSKDKCPTSFTDDCLKVKLKNKGNIKGPVLLSEMKGDSVLATHVIEGFKTDTSFNLYGIATDKIKIDPLLQMPEINRKNNTYWLKKIAHKTGKLRLQFIGSLEDQDRTQVCFAPYLGWNNYDKTQVGLAFYNTPVPGQKFNYMLVPAFGTGSKQFIGIAKLNYNFYPEQVQRFTVGLNARRFSYLLFPQNLTFNKLEPYLNIEVKRKDARNPYLQTLNFRSVVMLLDWINFESHNRETQHYYVNEFSYNLRKIAKLNPFSITATFRQGNQFALMMAEANFRITYPKSSGLNIRIFAGGFPFYFKGSSDITAPLPRLYLNNTTYNNFAYWLQQDYMFDENFFLDRNGRDKYLGRQVALTEGAFRSFTTFGATNKFLAAANFSSSILNVIPIRPFASLAVIDNQQNKIDFAAEFGLSVVAIPDMIEIHLPLITTENIRDNQAINGIIKWYQRFTFTLNIKLDKPINIIRRFAGI